MWVHSRRSLTGDTPTRALSPTHVATDSLAPRFKFEKAPHWKSVEVEFSMLDLADPASTFTFLQGCPRLTPVARWALGLPAAMISLENPKGTGSRPEALDGDKCWHKASPSWNIPFGRAIYPPAPTELFLFLNCPVPGCNDIKFATPAEAVTIANGLPQSVSHTSIMSGALLKIFFFSPGWPMERLRKESTGPTDHQPCR